MGTAFSSTFPHRVMISEISGLRKGASYERKILFTVPNTSLLALSCFSLGRGGSNVLGLFCMRPVTF